MISFRDPLIHSGVTLLVLPVLAFLAGASLGEAMLFWIGWEMGQKPDPAHPVLSRLRPFDLKNHPQSFAEWAAPSAAAALEIALMKLAGW